MDIQPIETLYADTLFRSRLEARWAVYFDALGIPWEYEPEHYKLSSGGLYLPDFSLFRGKILVEIKRSGGLFQKALALDCTVLLLDGEPTEPAVYRNNAGEHVYVGHKIASGDRRDDVAWAAYDELENGRWVLNPITLRAIQLARSERFGAHAPRRRHLLTVSKRIEEFGVYGPNDLAYLCELCVSETDLAAVGDYICEPRWIGSGACTVCRYGSGCWCDHDPACEYLEACQRICPNKIGCDGRCCLIAEGTDP